MNDVLLTNLKIISHPKGDLYHALKKSENSYAGFGEAYFSSVLFGEVKGWKKHTKMTLNLVVIVGEIRFVVYNDSNKTFKEYRLSRNNYQRLTVPAGYWVAFQGLSQSENLLLNLASIEHDANESINKDLKEISYEW